MVRLEHAQQNNPTKWFEIDIMPVGAEKFSVIMSYGMVGPSGEDVIIQPLKGIFLGPYFEAEDKLINKIKNRESLGYKKVEPKIET
jgi:hypothetical protein